MKVFISWSLEKSRDVAFALHDWLPRVHQGIDPYVSEQDIYAGTRWALDIAKELEGSYFGIVCVTQANRERPWLNFEAGALSRLIDVSRVVPLAIDLAVAEIGSPLGQFQGKLADKAGMTDVVLSINHASPQPLAEEILRDAVDVWWPRLEEKLREIAAKHESDAPSGRAERPRVAGGGRRHRTFVGATARGAAATGSH